MSNGCLTRDDKKLLVSIVLHLQDSQELYSGKYEGHGIVCPKGESGEQCRVEKEKWRDGLRHLASVIEDDIPICQL
jgi:hypothetical protein|tara:strand:+ start:25230 stop:25457 length:228 start_codon:yes stop_codon:yes gene_type:complete